MKRYLPSPGGNNAATEFYREQASQTRNQLPFRDTHQAKVQRTTTGQYLRFTVPSAGQASDKRWQTPKKELDPSKSVKKGTWVYISPNNDLAMTGLTDLVANSLMKSPAGIWEAAKAVPATAAGKYNVPQIPYPDATGTPTGTPLAGDLDGVNVFWILISLAPKCVT